MAALGTTEDGREETSTLQMNLPGAGLLSVNGLLWGSGSSKTDFLLQTQVPSWTWLFFFFWQNWYAHVKHLGSDKEWLNKLLRLMGKELYVKNAVVTLLSIKYSLISLYYKFIFCRYIWEGVWHSQGLCSFSQQITVKTCHVMSQMEFSPSRQAVLCELHLK